MKGGLQGFDTVQRKLKDRGPPTRSLEIKLKINCKSLSYVTSTIDVADQLAKSNSGERRYDERHGKH